MGHYKKLKAWLTGARSHAEGKTIKPNTEEAELLKLLCEGEMLWNWKSCRILKTGEGGRILRRVREKMEYNGIEFNTITGVPSSGRPYKITYLTPWQRDEARKLIVGAR